MATMLAFSIQNPGDEGKVISLPKPQPEPNFALIKILRAGVCNTDLEILQGYMGFTGVLGHEFVGIVEELNVPQNTIDSDANSTLNVIDLYDKWLGKRVCGDINVGCGDCGVCLNEHNRDACCAKFSRNHCPNRTVLGILNRNGTMAEYITLPITNLHLVPEGMSDEVAVFCEPLAAACRIPEQGLVNYGYGADGQNLQPPDRVAVYLRPPDRVAILGDGKLGLMIAEVLGREHARRNPVASPAPILFGKHAHKLGLVEGSGVERRFVSECIDATAFNGVSKDHAGKYDVVVDATGSPAGLTISSGLCRPMGTLVLKSTCAAGKEFNAAPFVIDELRVVGSRCGPIDTALELLNLDAADVASPTPTPNQETDRNGASGPVSDEREPIQPLRVEKYITQTFPLSEAADAIRCAALKSTMKVQIICSE
uniref:Alcohol dehydrogenase-like N-terminal domain-containing protein n=1 Tax=Proboscia inermis TaxID=420281 RepID=A0A7S0CD39_9STRA